jgi:hypothetical protein
VLGFGGDEDVVVADAVLGVAVVAAGVDAVVAAVVECVGALALGVLDEE